MNNSETMETTDLTFRFITFNAHPNNPSFLTIFLDLFLPKVRHSLTHYIVGIEKEGTPGRRVNILMGHKSFGDTQKFNQFVFFKEMKDFMQALKGSQTIWDKAYKEKKLPNTPESMLRNIGYILKECEPDNQEIRGFDREYIFDCKKNYAGHGGRVKTDSPSHLEDWKILTTKNAHNQILHFMHKNNTTIRDPQLVFKMKEKGYSFIDLTAKEQKEIIDDIKIRTNNYTAEEETLLMAETLSKLHDGQYSLECTKV